MWVCGYIQLLRSSLTPNLDCPARRSTPCSGCSGHTSSRSGNIINCFPFRPCRDTHHVEHYETHYNHIKLLVGNNSEYNGLRWPGGTRQGFQWLLATRLLHGRDVPLLVVRHEHLQRAPCVKTPKNKSVSLFFPVSFGLIGSIEHERLALSLTLREVYANDFRIET